MRKFLLLLTVILLVFSSCSKEDQSTDAEQTYKFINNGLPLRWENENTEKDKLVELTVTSEKTTFKLGESIRLLVLFKCNYRFGYDIEVVYSPTFQEASFDFLIKSDDGKQVYQKGYEYFKCEYPNVIKIYQELHSRQYWGLYTTVSMYYQFEKLGDYTIQLRHKYVSNFVHSGRLADNKYTVITSNVHKIRVVADDAEVTDELENVSVGLDNFPLEKDSEIVDGLKMNIYNTRETYDGDDNSYVIALIRNTTDSIIDIHKYQHGSSNNFHFDMFLDGQDFSSGIFVHGAPHGMFCYRLYPNTFWGCEVETSFRFIHPGVSEILPGQHKYSLTYNNDKSETILKNLWTGSLRSDEITVSVK